MKNYFCCIVLCFVLFCIAVSCKDTSSIENKCTMYFYPRYAKGFYILKENGNNDRYVLIIRNPSDTSQLISKIQIDKSKTNKLTTVACFSTTHLAFCDRLGCVKDVVGIPDSEFYLDTEILKKVEKNHAREITMASGTKTEMILELHPDYVFTSQYHNVDFTTIESEKITIVPVLEYLETHPLGRMEWVRLFGFLLDRDSIAKSVSNNIIENYNNIVSNNIIKSNRPKIIDLNEYNGYWYASGGKSYMAKLYEDAGYDYVWKDDIHNGSFPVSMEDALEKGMKTEYWRYVADCSRTTVVDKKLIVSLNDYYKLFRATLEGKIIACNPLVSGYYIEGVLEPDFVLKDFISARDSTLEKNYTPKYYYRISN